MDIVLVAQISIFTQTVEMGGGGGGGVGGCLGRKKKKKISNSNQSHKSTE